MIIARSNAFKNLYDDNSPTRFKVHLQIPLENKSLALLDGNFPTLKPFTTIKILCEQVEASLVGEHWERILYIGSLDAKSRLKISKPIFFKIDPRQIRELTFEIQFEESLETVKTLKSEKVKFTELILKIKS